MDRRPAALHSRQATRIALTADVRNGRHLCVSRALAIGTCLLMTGRLRGHAEVEATAGCARMAEASVRDAVVGVLDNIVADPLGDVNAAGTAAEP